MPDDAVYARKVSAHLWHQLCISDKDTMKQIAQNYTSRGTHRPRRARSGMPFRRRPRAFLAHLPRRGNDEGFRGHEQEKGEPGI
jgi:hypothetical protein